MAQRAFKSKRLHTSSKPYSRGKTFLNTFTDVVKFLVPSWLLDFKQSTLPLENVQDNSSQEESGIEIQENETDNLLTPEIGESDNELLQSYTSGSEHALPSQERPYQQNPPEVQLLTSSMANENMEALPSRSLEQQVIVEDELEAEIASYNASIELENLTENTEVFPSTSYQQQVMKANELDGEVAGCNATVKQEDLIENTEVFPLTSYQQQVMKVDELDDEVASYNATVEQENLIDTVGIHPENTEVLPSTSMQQQITNNNGPNDKEAIDSMGVEQADIIGFADGNQAQTLNMNNLQCTSSNRRGSHGRRPSLQTSFDSQFTTFLPYSRHMNVSPYTQNARDATHYKFNRILGIIRGFGKPLPVTRLYRRRLNAKLFKSHFRDVTCTKLNRILEYTREMGTPLLDTSPLISQGTSPVIFQDTSSFISRGTSPVIFQDTSSFISRGTSPVIFQDTSSFISRGTSPVIFQDTSSFISRGTSPVIFQDTSSFISRGTSPLIFEDTSPIISQDMSPLTSKDMSCEPPAVRNDVRPIRKRAAAKDLDHSVPKKKCREPTVEEDSIQQRDMDEPIERQSENQIPISEELPDYSPNPSPDPKPVPSATMAVSIQDNVEPYSPFGGKIKRNKSYNFRGTSPRGGCDAAADDGKVDSVQLPTTFILPVKEAPKISIENNLSTPMKSFVTSSPATSMTYLPLYSSSRTSTDVTSDITTTTTTTNTSTNLFTSFLTTEASSETPVQLETSCISTVQKMANFSFGSTFSTPMFSPATPLATRPLFNSLNKTSTEVTSVTNTPPNLFSLSGSNTTNSSPSNPVDSIQLSTTFILPVKEAPKISIENNLSTSMKSFVTSSPATSMTYLPLYSSSRTSTDVTSDITTTTTTTNTSTNLFTSFLTTEASSETPVQLETSCISTVQKMANFSFGSTFSTPMFSPATPLATRPLFNSLNKTSTEVTSVTNTPPNLFSLSGSNTTNSSPSNPHKATWNQWR